MTKYHLLLERFYNPILKIFWNTFPKKQILVNECLIRYMELPKSLLWGFNTKRIFPVEAMSLVHRPTSTTMIFVSKHIQKDRWFRYTLFHEYIEGLYSLDAKTFKEKNRVALLDIIHRLTAAYPDFMQSMHASAVDPLQSTGHICALLYEIDFAEKEMPPDELGAFLKDIEERRL